MRGGSLRVAMVMLVLTEVVRTLSSDRVKGHSPAWTRPNQHPLHLSMNPRRQKHRNRKPSFLDDYLPGYLEELRMGRGSHVTTTTSRNQFLLEQAALFNKLLQNVDYGCVREPETTTATKECSPKSNQKKNKKKAEDSFYRGPDSKNMSRKNLMEEEEVPDTSRPTEIARNNYEDDIITEKQMLDIILFISSLFLLFNVIFILGKCGCCRLGRKEGERYSSLCTLCNHSKNQARCPSCCCASIADPCDIYCCEKCELHCKAHCTHKPTASTFFFSKILRSFYPKKICDVVSCQCPPMFPEESSMLYDNPYLPPSLPHPPPPLQTLGPTTKTREAESGKAVSFSSDLPIVREPETPQIFNQAADSPIALSAPPQCICYDDRKDVEEKIKCLLKNAAKESSRGRIAAETALINVVTQISKFQNSRGLGEEEMEKEKRRIYCLVQKALKDIRNFKSCDMWGEDIIIDQTIQKIMSPCSCSLVSHSSDNQQFLHDLLHKAAYSFNRQNANTESILESTVDEIIKRRLIREAPADFCDPSTVDAPPEVRLRTYLKYQVAIVLCAEAHQRDHVIKKAYRNILRDERQDSEQRPVKLHHISMEAPPPAPPVEVDPTGAKWLHLTAAEPQDDRFYFSKESTDLEMSKIMMQNLKRPK